MIARRIAAVLASAGLIAASAVPFAVVAPRIVRAHDASERSTPLTRTPADTDARARETPDPDPVHGR